MLVCNGLLAAAGDHVTVETGIGGVALGADEPTAVLARIGGKDLVPQLVPGDGCRRGLPESFGIALPALVDLLIAAGRAAALIADVLLDDPNP